jgi:hypothetical protein
MGGWVDVKSLLEIAEIRRTQKIVRIFVGMYDLAEVDVIIPFEGDSKELIIVGLLY